MSATPRASILVVDRDEAARAKVVAWLTSKGAYAVGVGRGLDAVTRFLSGPVGLLLMTIDPNDMADLGAVARIRELPSGRDVPIVALTRASEGALGRVRMMAGPLRVAEYHTYPLDFGALWERLQALLGDSSAEASRRDEPTHGGPLTMDALSRTHQTIGRQNFFERLGIQMTEPQSAVRQAYLAAVYRYRPDALLDRSQEGRRLLREITDALTHAYDVLRDPTKRHVYEVQLQTAARPLTEPPSAPAPAPAPPAPTPPRPVAAQPTPPPADAAPPPTSRTGAPLRPILDGPITRHSLSQGAAPPPPVAARSSSTGTRPAAPSRPTRPPETSPAAFDVDSDDPWAPKGTSRETSEELAATAQVQSMMGDYDGAVKLFQAALALKPDSQDYQYKLELNLGRMFKKSGALSRARQHLEKAVALSPPGNTFATEELSSLGGGASTESKKSGGLAGLFKKK